MTSPTASRRAGSVRFAPYFKVETWDDALCVWHPIQKAHATEDAAVEGCPLERRSRITEVSERGRRILREVDHALTA